MKSWRQTFKKICTKPENQEQKQAWVVEQGDERGSIKEICRTLWWGTFWWIHTVSNWACTQGQRDQNQTHLSQPKNGDSVNSGIPAEMCTVKYPDFCQAIDIYLESGIACHVAKSDMASAFRHVPMQKCCWMFLIFKGSKSRNQKMAIFHGQMSSIWQLYKLCYIPSIFGCYSSFGQKQDWQAFGQLFRWLSFCSFAQRNVQPTSYGFLGHMQPG